MARTARPSAVPVPQPPLLFAVKCWIPLPDTKLSVHPSVERNAGQFDGTETGGGPPTAGLNPHSRVLGSQWIVWLMVEEPAAAAVTPMTRTRTPAKNIAASSAFMSSPFSKCPPNPSSLGLAD